MTEERLIDRLRIFAAAGGAAAIILATSGCSQEPTEANAVGHPLAASRRGPGPRHHDHSGRIGNVPAVHPDEQLTHPYGENRQVHRMGFPSFLFHLLPHPRYGRSLFGHAESPFRNLGRRFPRAAFAEHVPDREELGRINGDVGQRPEPGITANRGCRGRFRSGAGPDSQIVSIPLDTAMVRTWLSSTATTKYGIVFIPNADCSIIRGFTAFSYDSASYQPQLTIIAGSPTGSARDTAVYTLGSNTFVGNADNLTTNPSFSISSRGSTSARR